MTYRNFLDASYTLLVEEYQRLGMNLVDIQERTEDFRPKQRREDRPQREPSEAATARQNEDSFQQFQQLMKGVTP